MEDRGSTALYLFPTKALAQDQSRTLATLVGDGRGPRHGIFDGDTPPQDRADVRRYAQLVVTNPDMLHLGILPNHRSWRRFLRGLRYVVVDEAHAFRGVFGSHVANVLRRLRRLCAKMRASPQFVLCSATIANPGEHAERLAGLPFRVVDEDGAPSGGRDFVFWNPPVIDEGRGRRRSSNTEATALFTELVRREVRTLAFVRSRKMAELLYVYARDKLGEEGGGLAERIAPYRGTYLPEDRRRIERDMFQGRLLGPDHHQRHGAWNRHRRPGRDHIGRIPRQRLQHLAAGGPQRQERRARPERPCRLGQSPGPVRHAPPGEPLRRKTRERPHLARKPLRPQAAPAVRRLRGAPGDGRHGDLRPRSAPVRRRAPEQTAYCTPGRAAGTWTPASHIRRRRWTYGPRPPTHTPWWTTAAASSWRRWTRCPPTSSYTPGPSTCTWGSRTWWGAWSWTPIRPGPPLRTRPTTPRPGT